ncbi:glycosyltransferase [Sphingorhabdus sp. Alg231-15]|uniref:glycosyltransferase n=1 Tax=Sphingorhabdus sp. Alg231-15 TaxID=1922222 RepID=UPI000D54EFDA
MSQIAIITLTFNNSQEFQRTAQSLARSRAAGLKFRWIIVDGGSYNAHQAIIKENMIAGDTLVIETKRGIYRAMNCGLNALENEDHAVFLNSGDCQHWDAVQHLSELDPNETYGFNAIIVAGPYAFNRTPLHAGTGLQRLPLHGAFLFRVPDAKRIAFEDDRMIDADSRWMIRVVGNKPLKFVDVPHSIFALDGVSAGQSFKALRAILNDKPWYKAPLYVSRFIGFKLLGWHLYPLLYWKKFSKLPARDFSKIKVYLES